MSDGARWSAALADHAAAVREYVESASRLAGAAWAREPAPGKWSVAAVTLHLCRSYELGTEGAAGGPGMRLRVSPLTARLTRSILLPVILRGRWFPRGVPAPREIRPDAGAAAAAPPGELLARLARSASAAAGALRGAPATTRMRHAYFGPLTPLDAMRLLSAHTRHHTRALRAAAR